MTLGVNACGAQALRAQFRQQLIQMIQRRVIDRQAPGALLSRHDRHPSAQTFGELLFEGSDITVVRNRPVRLFTTGWRAGCKSLGFAHRKPACSDFVGKLHLPGTWKREQRSCMAHLQFPLHQHLSHRDRQRKQPEQIRDGASGAANRVSRNLVGHTELVDQSPDAGRLFDWIQVLALDVLDQRHCECSFITHFAYNDGDTLQTRQARRAPAPLTRDDLELPLSNRAREDRLDYALRLDRFSEQRNGVWVHVRAWLILTRLKLMDRQLLQALAGLFRLIRSEQRVKAAPQTFHLSHGFHGPASTTFLPLMPSRRARPSIDDPGSRPAYHGLALRPDAHCAV